ncbi:MAG: cupin domain-containing protein [Candidatus Pacearchaeota archaeon]
MDKIIDERVEKVFKSSDPFSDKRGRIDNYSLPYPVNMANIITTIKPNDNYPMRANHYHPEQTQMCLVISGSYISVHKDLAIPDAPVRSHLVRTGDLVLTPPMVAHTMIFLDDTTFINLVGGNRDHNKFNKEHTITYNLVPETDIMRYLEMHKEEIAQLKK